MKNKTTTKTIRSGFERGMSFTGWVSKLVAVVCVGQIAAGGLAPDGPGGACLAGAGPREAAAAECTGNDRSKRSIAVSKQHSEFSYCFPANNDVQSAIIVKIIK